MKKRVRVVRTIVVEGERNWVESTMAKCSVSPNRSFTTSFGTISEPSRETYERPENPEWVLVSSEKSVVI